MLLFLSNADRVNDAALFERMFRTRAEVFQKKLGWDVEVRDGLEHDRYDLEADPLYLMLIDDSREVIGSLPLLPTTGDTMMSGEFAQMFDEPLNVRISGVWECTRFCVPNGGASGQHVPAGRAASELLIGLCGFCLGNGIDQILGVYEQAMTRVYRRIGWTPSPLAKSKPEAGNLYVGIWDVTETALANMRRSAKRGEEARAA